MNGEEDHVHIFFEADPYTTPGELVNVVKTKPAASPEGIRPYDSQKILLEATILE